MLFDSLRLSSKPKEEKYKEEEENESKNESKNEHKKITFYCLQKRWKKGGGYIGVTPNIGLSLLHESQSNLCLQRNKNYIKRK